MRRIWSRKYFIRLLASLLALSSVLVWMMSLVLSANFESALRKNEYKNSMTSLAQISYGRESMDMLANNLGRILLTNSYVEAAMTSSSYNSITSTAALNVINTITLGANGIDSIYFYNEQLGTITCGLTGETVPLERFYDQGLQELWENTDRVENFSPIYRELTGAIPAMASSEIYTYCFPYRSGNTLRGMIFINFRTELLSETIQILSQKGDRNADQLFAVDMQGRVVCSTGNRDMLNEEDYAAITQQCTLRSESADAFEMKLSDGKLWVVTFTRGAQDEWIFISLSNQERIEEQVHDLTVQVTIISAAFSLFAIAFAVIVANHLYRPIAKMDSHISSRMKRTVSKDDTGRRDEFVEAVSAFNQIAESAEVLERKSRQNRHQVQNTLIAKLLSGELSPNKPWVQEKFRMNNLHIPLENGKTYAMLLLKVNQWDGLQRKYSEKEREATFFGVINIVTELLETSYHSVGAYMREGQFCFLLEIAHRPENFLFDVTGEIEQVQLKLQEILSLDVTAVIGDPFVFQADLSENYAMLQEISQYSFLLGNCSIVDAGILEQVDNEYYLVSARQKKQLIEAIRQGQLEKVQKTYQEISDQVCKHSYQNIFNTYLYLGYVIYSECFTVEVKNSSFSALMLSFVADLSKMETKQEVDQAFNKLFGQIVDCFAQMNQKQVPDIVDQVITFVETHYQDKNLSLNMVAQEMDRSAAYVGRVFKERTDQSVSEYILQVRMQQLKRLLDTTNLPLADILDQIGMEKTNYFYTLFKKYFGISFASYDRSANQAKHAE